MTGPVSQTTEPRGCPTPGACSAATEIDRLRSLLDRVMVSGNHLATHVDLDGPTWHAPHDEGLTYYGAGPAYDAWCCWKGIMLVREDLNRG